MLLETQVIRLFLLETLTVLDNFFREPKTFALFNLETLTLLAYIFRDSKISLYLILIR